MIESRKAELLYKEVEAILEPVSVHPELYRQVTNALYGTSPQVGRVNLVQPLLLLPLHVCEAISGKSEIAIPLAAAFLFFRAAGDLFDDIEDGDFPESALPNNDAGIVNNVASTLLILGEKALTSIEKEKVAARTIIQIIDTFNSAFTIACVGQHNDLSLSREGVISEERYLKIAEMKTGSPLDCAARTGALIAGADLQLTNQFGLFGQKLGIASQITNDIQGIVNLKDILKPKLTLPIIYALTQSEGPIHDQLFKLFCGIPVNVPDPIKIRDILLKMGSLQYAEIKVEYYKLRARDILLDIASEGVNIDQLRALFS